MKMSDHLLLWNQASIKVIDVRRTVMEPGEMLRSYRLPSSTFIYTIRGSAQVSMDGNASFVDRFHVLHGGKGMCLDIAAQHFFEYYMIFYKSVLALPARQPLVKLMEMNNPFQLQLSFAPDYPIPLYHQVERMEKEWLQPSLMEKLHIKVLFYQFVYELLNQMSRQGIQGKKVDLVSQAMRYLQENYADRVTLDELAELLDCSVSYLSRKFKQTVGKSPIDYMIALRIDKAKELLLNTDATLQEIAESVGFSDDSYFNRMFKKHVGLSLGQFKVKVQNNPADRSRYAIVPHRLRRYIGNGYENHYHYKKVGRSPMYSGKRTPMAASLLLCFILLLSACSTGTSNTNSANGGSNPVSANVSTSTPAPTDAASTEAPRVIKHAMGETTLTGTPERVVILTNEGTEALLAVGITPIGAVQSWIGDPWYDHIKDEMQEVTAVGDELQPNIEMIASLKPDLIIGNKVRQEKIYEQLNQIAPTVFAEDLGGDWKVNFKLYMDAVNKTEEGDKAMAEFDKRVAEVKSKIGDKANTKVSVARFSASQVRIYQKQTFSGVLLNDLGFARPESQDKDSFIEVMTKETIPSMDGDVLFYFVTEAAGKTDAAKVVEEWMNDPLFKKLNVVQNNKVVQVDEAIWNTAGGYKAANLLLDEIVAYFDIK
ncbi:helix-turn-helix domain-containing protein [Paenibacillus pinisoli]|uniref:Helix-turn-helix domain-containing protein n=1 Tax=Paenibacillus pinisoli TaxID=1276110 RepID=A0A3A6PEB9_9BACL|nr:AraC family transcriptional regulator [Paenibacillus pinisoli]RJX39015.1 helix-turn-helix domain-containing protein [Paenibacillus pinisoli]